MKTVCRFVYTFMMQRNSHKIIVCHPFTFFYKWFDLTYQYLLRTFYLFAQDFKTPTIRGNYINIVKGNGQVYSFQLGTMWHQHCDLRLIDVEKKNPVSWSSAPETC